MEPHGFSPQRLDDKILLASFVGEAFESVDLTTVLSKAMTVETWIYLGPIYDKLGGFIVSDFLKITNTVWENNCFRIQYLRENPELPIGNPQTGGVLESRIVFLNP